MCSSIRAGLELPVSALAPPSVTIGILGGARHALVSDHSLVATYCQTAYLEVPEKHV